MTNRDIFDLELSPGEQPKSAFGDRLLVGIAGLALLAGLAIAVINAVPHDGTAQASPTPSVAPSRTPIPVPTPQPPRVSIVAAPDVQLAQPGQGYRFSGYVRSLDGLDVYSSPDLHGSKVGAFAKGAVSYADQQEEPPGAPGWLSIQDPSGWIASISADGTQLVHRYEYPRYRSGGWVNTLNASDRGFLAMLSAASDANGSSAWGPAVSGDGAIWHGGSASAFNSWNPNLVAWGPAGWLAVSYVSDENGSRGLPSTSRIWIWSSADGTSWKALGMMTGLTSDYPGQLIATDRGYLFQTQPQNGSSGAVLWFSTDGRTWTESKEPLLNNAAGGNRRFAGLAGGFYAWDAFTDPSIHPAPALFSTDGTTWRKVAGGPDGLNLQLTTYRGQALAIDADPKSLAARVWSGSVVRGQMLWIRRPEDDAALRGVVVTQLVTDGTRAYAFGWGWSDDRPFVWTKEGSQWTRSELPGSFGGIPTQAAAGASGVVVVGHRPTWRGDNPIFWHRSSSGAWLPETNPILTFVPDPSADECPAPPTDYLDFMVADTAALVVCRGDAPISFRAWSVECPGCSGYQEGGAEPAWLLRPSEQLYLSPVASQDANWWGASVLRPPLTMDPSWASTWIEVTGHYDDPAAATCHSSPTPDVLQWWQGQQALVNQCRQTFVATGVKVVSGP
jgi:hypothetical protein